MCRQNIRNSSEKIISDVMPEVATLVSMITSFWCSLEVAAAELHLCSVMKSNLWWKRTFLPMFTIVVLHHKHLKLSKPFIPHVIAWSLRKGFNQSIRRTKEQKTTLQCLESRPVVLKLFLIAYHLRVPCCHHVPPCSSKSQCAKYHSIKSLENQNWHKCNVNKMAVRTFDGHF